MNLNVRRIGKIGTLAVALNGSGAVAAHGVGGEEIGVAITTSGDDDGVGGESLQLAGDEVLGNDATCATVDNHHVFHLVAGVELHLAGLHLCRERRIGAQQQLLARLSLGVERTAHLGTAERTVGQHAAILAGEGNTLGHALVDDVVGHLGQTIDVGLAGAVVATLHGVVEQTINRVAVILIVLGGVDATLCGNGVGAARRILNAQVDDIEAHLAERSGGTGSGQTRSNHNHVELQLVLGVNQTLVSLIFLPFLRHWTCGNL